MPLCARIFSTVFLDRGLKIEEGVLCVMDGSKGISKAVEEIFGSSTLIQRCQWHKRENVVDYLPKSQRATWRKKLQRAYEEPTYEGAKMALKRVAKNFPL